VGKKCESTREREKGKEASQRHPHLADSNPIILALPQINSAQLSSFVPRPTSLLFVGRGASAGALSGDGWILSWGWGVAVVSRLLHGPSNSRIADNPPGAVSGSTRSANLSLPRRRMLRRYKISQNQQSIGTNIPVLPKYFCIRAHGDSTLTAL